MNNNYGHIGRPTNEEVKKKKNLKIIKVLFILILIVGVIFAICFFNKKIVSNDKNATFGKVSDRMSSKPVFSVDSNTLESNALQGSAGYKNIIYYATTLTAGRQKNDEINQKKDVGATAYYYNLNSKKNINFQMINNEMRKTRVKRVDNQDVKYNFTDYKNNDITINESEGRPYYLYTANDSSSSKIVAKVGSKVKIIDTKDTAKKIFYNIGYSGSLKKFASLDQRNIYFYTLDNNKVNITSTCKLNNYFSDLNQNNYKHMNGKKYDVKPVLQGITMKGKILYAAYQIRYYEVGTMNSNNPKVAFETNHINVYDTRNCSSKTELSYSKKYNLGKANGNKYELESIFFMNGKLYLGYSNNYYNIISFYTLNLSNTSTLTLTATKTKDATVLTGKINAIDNHSGVLYYSFCKYSERSKCKFHSITSEGKYKLPFGKYEIKESISSSTKGTYYFHITDNFGKQKSTSVKIK